jgi:hypothetical protein
MPQGTGSGSTAAGFDPTAPVAPTSGDGRAQQTAGAAKEKASDVAGTAKEQAAAVAGSAKEQAGDVLAEAKGQAVDLLGDLRRQLAEQSEGVRDRLAEFLTGAGSELGEMAGAGGSGYATQVVRQVGDRASSWGSHLRNHDATDLLDQTRRLARRKPGTFLLGAVAAGVLAGRLTRGAKAAHDASQDTAYATPPALGTAGTTPTSTGTLVPPVAADVRPVSTVGAGYAAVDPTQRDLPGLSERDR